LVNTQNDVRLELPKTQDGFFPKRKSKYLKMLQNYTTSKSDYMEAPSSTVQLTEAKKDLNQISKNANMFDENMRKMKSKLGYNKVKQEYVVKQLGEMMNDSVEDVSPTKRKIKPKDSNSTAGTYLFILILKL
jgi:hypothetical protein